MIKQIELTNFKCYQKQTRFELGKINLLTGINGKGKSTFLQSLLLFRQSVEHNERADSLLLNGTCVRLGTFSDTKNAYNSSKDPIVIGFKISNESFGYESTDIEIFYKFTEDAKDERKLQLQEWYCQSESKILSLDPLKRRSKKKSVHIKRQKNIHDKYIYLNDAQKEEIFHLLLPTVTQVLTNDKYTEDWAFQQYLSYKTIHYIGADRFGPQEFYSKNNISDFVHVGKQGELVADVLSHAKKEQLITDSSLARSEDRLILSQVSEWLGYILDQPIFSIVLDDADKYRSSILFKMGDKTYAAPNVGFGYAYMLPIVVSGLIAKKGEVLIIENPEAHLHPKGQSRLTKFLAKVASCGIQVFIETHSEHVLNALRVVSVMEDYDISNTDINVFYFQANEGQPVRKIFIEPDGGINDWPDDFFDQTDKDFKILFGF